MTISLEPTFEVRDRCGLSTSTRNMIQKIWPVKLPKMNPEMLARLVFCFENNPERHDGIISGAQDSIGICVPGLALADAADACWEAILKHDLDGFAAAYKASFEAQIAMFPAMVNPYINGEVLPEASVQPYIDKYSALEEVLAWKMPGAGGGGYLALVVNDSNAFVAKYPESFELHIRRE